MLTLRPSSFSIASPTYMDTKGSDGSRASTAGKADGSWWRWTHGKSGSISSSSSSSPVLAVGGGHAEPASSHVHSLSSSNVHASSSSPVRWLKRSPARGVAREESSSGASAWTASSGSPKFFASFAGSSRGSSVPASRKNRASGSTGRTVAGRKIPTEYAQGEIAWTTGVAAKRKAASRKDRRSGRGSTSGHAVGSRVIGRATRSYLPEFVVDGDAQMASSSVFEFSQDKAGRKPGGSHSTGVSSSSKAFSSTGKTDSAASSPSSSSAASTLSLSSASSMGSSPFAGAGRSDPVVDCARAVLQDCIRQRHMEYNNARKRAIEGWNEFEAKGSGWQHASVTKASDWSMMSSSSRCGSRTQWELVSTLLLICCCVAFCCSSSSDEELSQLSSLDHSFAWYGSAFTEEDALCELCIDDCVCVCDVCLSDDKYDRDMCESKMSNEEVLRQSMLRGCALSSSPELECFSPLIEEK